jgi:hypothetical protein
MPYLKQTRMILRNIPTLSQPDWSPWNRIGPMFAPAVSLPVAIIRLARYIALVPFLVDS